MEPKEKLEVLKKLTMPKMGTIEDQKREHQLCRLKVIIEAAYNHNDLSKYENLPHEQINFIYDYVASGVNETEAFDLSEKHISLLKKLLHETPLSYAEANAYAYEVVQRTLNAIKLNRKAYGQLDVL